MSACRIVQVLDACCYGVGAISNRHIHPDVVCLCQLCSRERAGFSGWFVHLYGQPVHACLTQLQEQDASFSCGIWQCCGLFCCLDSVVLWHRPCQGCRPLAQRMTLGHMENGARCSGEANCYGCAWPGWLCAICGQATAKQPWLWCSGPNDSALT
jgi:hypothetical protein